MNDILLINNGDIFDGTREQFSDCFFSNSQDENIIEWCIQQGFTLRINGVITV